MTRVLYLRAEASDEQARRLSGFIARDAEAGVSIEVRTVGRGGTYRSPFHGGMALRRDLGRFDVVHAWDSVGLAAARWAGAPVVLASMSAGVERAPTGWFSDEGSIEWVCSTPVQLAKTAKRLGPDVTRLIEPGVERSMTHWGRDALRKELGFGPDDRLLLAPGDSTRAAGHETGVWVMSMLHIIDPRFKLLIAGTGPRVTAARELAARLNRPELLCVAADTVDVPSRDLATAADAALYTPSEAAPPLPILECMSAGLPIIATDHPTLAGLLSAACLAAAADWKRPPEIARLALEAFDRPMEMREAGERGRAEARGRFRVADFVEKYASVYRSLAARAPAGHSADATVA